MLTDHASLNSLALFRGCSAAQLRLLAPHVVPLQVKRYAELCVEGAPSDYIHIVLQGEVCLEKKREGHDEPARLFVVRAGEHFGLGEFMLSNYHTSATALTDCSLLRISSEDFRLHFLPIPSIRDRVLTELSEIARYLLFDVVTGSGTAMLAFYLRRMALEHGREQDGKIHIQTLVRQPEIASLLNMSREHVTRLFTRLHEEGAVDFNRGFPIIDKQWLAKAVRDTDMADFIVYRDYPTPNADHRA